MDMDMDDAWRLARESTRLARQRKNLLYTFGATKLPYLCLASDRRTNGMVLVRQGAVSAHRPQIALPGDEFHHFEGFGPHPGEDGPDLPGWPGNGEGLWVRIARRIALPGAKYVHESESGRSEPGPLDVALERAVERLDREGDIRTAVLATDARVWRLGVLLYAASQMARSAESNIREHLEHRIAGMGKNDG